MPTDLPASVIEFKVSGRSLQFDRRLWFQLEGPKPQEGWECNGCSFSPDFWLSIRTGKRYPLVVACVIHDHHYSEEKPLGAGWKARAESDAILRRNLRRVIVRNDGSLGESERIAWLYWGRVRLWGGRAWRGGPSLMTRLKRVWKDLF